MAEGQETATSMAALSSHSGRAAALGEIHARPAPAIESGRVILHFAFTSDGGASVSHSVLSELCRSRGMPAPDADARYHQLDWGQGTLGWERHSEFTTFSWVGPAPRRFLGDVTGHPFGSAFKQPGKLISACRVEIRKRNATSEKLLDRFDPASRCVSVLEDDASLVATDFRQDGNGMTVFLLLENNLTASRIGQIAKTLTDLETYRTLALVGLPLAQALSSRLSGFEAELGRLTSQMRAAEKQNVQQLLDEITSLAGELEADAAASLFRLGATRAYGEIVQERMETLGSKAYKGNRDVSGFLDLRLGPALRTCRSVEDRQLNLSEKLARTATLLRTRVDVEIERQNRDLLESMNRRARLQLRLQQTVEGLSVAAVSYYVVGLFYYMAQAGEEYLPLGISATLLTGLFVPFAILAIWLGVRAIRRRSIEKD